VCSSCHPAPTRKPRPAAVVGGRVTHVRDGASAPRLWTWCRGLRRWLSRPSNEGSSPGRPVRRLPWLGVFGAAADVSSARVSSRGPISSVRTGHGWRACRPLACAGTARGCPADYVVADLPKTVWLFCRRICGRLAETGGSRAAPPPCRPSPTRTRSAWLPGAPEGHRRRVHHDGPRYPCRPAHTRRACWSITMVVPSTRQRPVIAAFSAT
jgi:hypothetical protein